MPVPEKWVVEMDMRRAVRLLVGVSIVCGVAVGAARAAGDDPLLNPIMPDTAKRWLGAQKPFRLHGQTYMVGFEGLAVGLVRTSKGLILIDGAVPQSVPAVEANIRKLGFKLSDVKYILSTEPHYDHGGGIAALARDTGAMVLAGVDAIEALRTGRPDATDPQATILPNMPGIKRLRAVKHGEQIRLGDTAITAVATPGHTPGSTSWSWRSCEGKQCYTIVFAASINPVSADGYRFSAPANAAIVQSFRRSFTTMRALPCDIMLTSHSEQPRTQEGAAQLGRARTPNPFVNPNACRAYAEDREAALNARLKRERDGA
jgi:metallo-beta-lactamase class B